MRRAAWPQLSRESFEALEPRALLSAPYGVPADAPIVTSSQVIFPIRFHSDGPIDLSTIADGDIAVAGPGGFAQAAHLLSAVPQSNGDVLARFAISAPGGQWNWPSANGTYALSMAANVIRNAAGEGNIARGVASYWMWFNTPRLTITSQQLVPGTGAFPANDFSNHHPSRDDVWSFQLHQTSPTPTNARNVVIRVTGPNGYDQSGFAVEPLSYRQEPTYWTDIGMVGSVLAPGGYWDFSDSGVYTVQVGLGVSNSSGSPILGDVLLTQTFTQNIAAPRAEVTASNVRLKDWLVTVRYTPAPGNSINLSSITDGDITASRQFYGDDLAGTLVQPPTLNTDGSVTAVYSIASRNADGWTYYDSGTYFVRSRPGQVLDAAGNALGVGPISAGYNLSFNLPSFISQRTLSATAAGWDVELNFNNVGGLLNSQTFSAQDIQIWTATSSGTIIGLAPVQVQFLSSSNSPDNTLALHYRVLPQSGPLTDGNYTVRLVNLALYQAAFPGGGVSGVLPPVSLHFAGPSVMGLQTLSRTSTAWDIDLTFSNPGSLINTSSLSAQNLIITPPGGQTVRVSLVSFSNTNGVLHVHYRIQPISFILAPGAYTFALRDSSITVRGMPPLPGRTITSLTI